MIDPFYLADRTIQVGFNITLAIHHNTLAKSIIVNKPYFPELGIDFRFFNRILKDMTCTYARLNIGYIYQYRTVFSARFDKQDENNQVLDEIEIYINLKINQKLTKSDFVRIHIKSSARNQVQKQEAKCSGCRLDKIISMTIYFFKKLMK